MLINISTLLLFFDEKPTESRGHATSVVAVAGEDLGAALFTYYLRQQGAAVEILPEPCTQRTPKGSRLDKWIRRTQGNEITYYQVEIKNWYYLDYITILG